MLMSNLYAYFKSLQHQIDNIFMKMFATKSDEVVTECQQAFGFQPIRNQFNCWKIKFLNRYVIRHNCICTIACNQCAERPMFKFISSTANKLCARLSHYVAQFIFLLEIV